MARQTFRVEGLSDLEDALSELSKATGKNVLKRALTNAGEPIAEDAARHARRRSGKLEGSYGVSTKLSRRQKSIHTKESAVEVFAGPGALVQAITEEFGTSQQAPHPTMRPAWDGNKMSALNSVKDGIAAEIDKAAQRAARKAARQIALAKR